MDVVALDNLSEETTQQAIEVRVLRRWSTRLKQNGTSYIVVDRNADAIQISTLPEYKDASNEELEILHCYKFSRFICSKPASYLRSVSHPLGIIFRPAVIVEPIEDSRIYPKYYFEFTSFRDLTPSTPTKEIITDYIGTLEEIVEGTTATRDPFLRLSLRDSRGHTIRCRLWKEIIQNPQRFNRTAIENAPRPAIIAVTTVKITKPFEWIQLGATAATYVYLNPDIPDAIALKNCSHTGSSSSVSTTPVPIVSSTLEKKDISELLQFDRQTASGRTFVCDAAISDIIITEEGWFKSQCTIGTCSLTAYWRDGFWTCPARWRIAECKHMYHITATITDSTGSANAIFYNYAGQTIVGSPCSELITAETIRDPSQLPATIIQTKGKTF
ncbi:hypothetical protein SSX86_024961 [Deinandra increscens subsp. villosa]|uniref:Uncharacterized protein n=1 Tax=Deinandra increscens subsp. villosa TaxID=3103831 RepID=A0AAP0CDB1_9ASTR